MDNSTYEPGERIITSEYLKESGLLLVDISTLVSRIETSRNRKDTEESFNFVDYVTPYELPKSITDAIGPVQVATISFSREPEPSISVDLYGEESSYNATRYADSDSTAVDAILDVPPIDPISQAFLTAEQRRSLPHNLESDEEFEKRIHNIPGIPMDEFVAVIISILYPTIFSNIPKDKIELLLAINVFDPRVFEQLADTSRSAVMGQTGTIEYAFATSDDAHLSYIYEDGHPASFDFSCINANNDQPLKIRAEISQKIEVEFPTHVVETGLNQDAIDRTRDFALDLSEVKYVREIIQEEIATLPDIDDDSLSSDLDPWSIEAPTNFTDVVDNAVQAAQKDRDQLLQIEIEDYLHNLSNPSQDSDEN